MIISRAPVRITLGGGGTDIPSYYSQYGGFVLAGAINKYLYAAVNRAFGSSLLLTYSEIEKVEHIRQIKHNIAREALRLLGVKNHIEIVSMADVPAGTGLGSSGSFAVSLLKALHVYKNESVSPYQLAEEACKLEIEILKAPVGKQDQYMAVFGGVTSLAFAKNGKVTVKPVRIKTKDLKRLEENILLFYTGIVRKSASILKEEDQKIRENYAPNIEALHEIKKIAFETKEAVESGNLDRFGELLNLHWQTKKKLSKKVSSVFLDECYETALKNGALGGKIMGAGGGGFFLFYHPGKDKSKLVRAMVKKGLQPMPFRFDFEGARIIPN